MSTEVKKYADGTEIKQFPKWVYPGGKPAHASPANRTQHNGVLVQNEEELKAALVEFGEATETPKSTSEIDTKKASQPAKTW